MDMTKPCAGKKNDTRRNGCCEEESIVLKGKETNAEVQAVAQIIPSFNLIAVILPVLYTVVDLDVFSAATRYAHYRPPLIERDITVLVQSFLI